MLHSSLTRFTSFIPVSFLITLVPLHIILLHSRHLLVHPSLVLLLMKFLSFSLSLLTLTDLIPTSLLKQCYYILLPTLTKIINLSISTGDFPDQFKAAQFILISRNQVWTKKVSLIIVLYLIFSSCLNLQNELLNYVLPSICKATTCSILSSLLTSNIILLKLLFFLFMTTSSRLWVDDRSLVSLFLTCLLLLIL